LTHTLVFLARISNGEKIPPDARKKSRMIDSVFPMYQIRYLIFNNYGN